MTEFATNQDEKSGAAAKAGKYLTFTLDGEEYGIEILKVREVLGMAPVTRVAEAPEFVRGVMDFRGDIVSVIDLRLKFGLSRKDDTERTRIIVAEVVLDEGPVTLGLVVDGASEVRDVSAEEIEIRSPDDRRK
ncbi:MAG: Receptor-coupling factor, CheW [Fibrobacteres bacterium]|nr:Receptor-coupling factor, CheW [Fibrobacterota bacterium]